MTVTGADMIGPTSLPPYWIGSAGGPRWSRPLLSLQPMGSASRDGFKLAWLYNETVNLPGVLVTC